ncbi:MAG: phosphate acyltransferase PlsX [Solirubrobacterales bacterium]|nr:phosphate acyltransferase PlsX [Solirubrobacterales bacterium]
MNLSGTTVALDGLGVENGFDVLEAGIRLAATSEGIGLRVFGPASELDLADLNRVEVIDSTDQITNEDDPVPSVRSRPDASIVRAVADVAAGNSDAVVSLGSTGATMAASTFGLKRSRGVKRPALAAQVPLPGRTVVFLDVGANVDVRAQHLVQFAWLGAAFAKSVLGVERPEVGLLSVGEEAGKGREEVVEAHAALTGADEFEFVGNVEGRDLPAGVADVIVTDGFTGNVVLKALEGTVKTVVGAISEAARKNPVSAVGGLMMKPALGGLRRDLHPDTTGGAILLGLRKTAVVGHGSSGAEGVANAIRVAARAAAVDAPGLTEEMLHRVGANRGSIGSEPGV